MPAMNREGAALLPAVPATKVGRDRGAMPAKTGAAARFRSLQRHDSVVRDGRPCGASKRPVGSRCGVAPRAVFGRRA